MATQTLKRSLKAVTKKRAKAKPQPAFETLDPQSQRIAIAKDVLKQIKSKRMKATQRTYLKPNPISQGRSYGGRYTTGEEILANTPVGEDLQTIFKKQLKTCECCAKGAMFLAAVERFDACPVTAFMKSNSGKGSSFHETGIMRYMKKFFSRSQLNLIEYAFEIGTSVDGDGNKKIEKENATEFGLQYQNAEDRLVAIMKNIIKNEGTFVP